MIEIKKYTTADTSLADKAFEIRRKVFVEEQKVPREEEFDVYETTSTHYLLFINGTPAATARWRFTDKGIKLERFAVLKEYRGRGYGSVLLKTVMIDVKPQQRPVYLHAQLTAINFYEKEGFVKYGPKFSECDIEHYCMKYAAGRKALNKVIGSVEEFHEAFKIANEYAPKALLSDADYLLRHRLMHEENEEYLDACKKGDLTEIADALGDKLYILCGTILKHGLQDKIEEVFNEIHRSNMSKLDENGQPLFREDGKVLKGTRYFKPDIKRVLSIE